MEHPHDPNEDAAADAAEATWEARAATLEQRYEDRRRGTRSRLGVTPRRAQW